MPGARSVIVIGGGVIGLCSAYYAVQRGLYVTVLERGGPDHDSCSLGNAGMFVPSHFVPLAAPGMVSMGLRMMLNPESPFRIRPSLNRDLAAWGWRFVRAANARHVAESAPLLRDLHLESRRCYEEMTGQLGDDFGFSPNGLLMLCKTEPALREETHLAEQARQLGLLAEVLPGREVSRIDPDIEMDVAGAVYYPIDGHFTPTRFIAALTRTLEAGGVEFAWGAEAVGWRTQGRCIQAVRTNRGDVTADEVVIAGGAWSAELARRLGIRLPLQAGKGYSLTLAAPCQRPSVCSILTEDRVAVTPMGSALRFAGTMEITGLDLSVNRRRVEGILKSIPRYFPALSPNDFRETPVWSGLRPCSPDGLPYVGRVGRFDNLSIATGHAMMGMSLGPVTGKLMAEILSGEPPSISIEAIRPDRYDT